jgi:hypothetical protein
LVQRFFYILFRKKIVCYKKIFVHHILVHKFWVQYIFDLPFIRLSFWCTDESLDERFKWDLNNVIYGINSLVKYANHLVCPLGLFVQTGLVQNSQWLGDNLWAHCFLGYILDTLTNISLWQRVFWSFRGGYPETYLLLKHEKCFHCYNTLSPAKVLHCVKIYFNNMLYTKCLVPKMTVPKTPCTENQRTKKSCTKNERTENTCTESNVPKVNGTQSAIVPN